MSNVVTLASSREKPATRACEDCRYFYPMLDKPSDPLTAKAVIEAICSALGGERTIYARRNIGACKPDAHFFEPRDPK